MEISVQLKPDAIPSELDELRGRLDQLGVELEPVHPGEDDPLLAPYFAVEVPEDEGLADGVLSVLNESAAVEAAYVKPAAELP